MEEKVGQSFHAGFPDLKGTYPAFCLCDNNLVSKFSYSFLVGGISIEKFSEL